MANAEIVALENKEGKSISAEVVGLRDGSVSVKMKGTSKIYGLQMDSLTEESQKLVKQKVAQIGRGNAAQFAGAEELKKILEPRIERTGKKTFGKIENPDTDIFGMQFGDSYEQLVAKHGKPNTLGYAKDEALVAVYGNAIEFRFVRNSLKGVSIQRWGIHPGTFGGDTDRELIEKFSLMGDIVFGMKKEELEKNHAVVGEDKRLYLKGLKTNVTIHTHQRDDGVEIVGFRLTEDSKL